MTIVQRMLVIFFLGFLASCYSTKRNLKTVEKFRFVKQNAKPLIDSLYMERYQTKKWVYEKAEYDMANHREVIFVLKTHLKSNKNYGMEVCVDTNYNISNVTYFIAGFD